MIKLPMVTDWNICTPTLYRFLNNQYVDSFLSDGSIRISSFSQFHKHKDEQRLDEKEGKVMFVHRTSQNGGQTITAKTQSGINAYVLCTSMRYDEDLIKSFEYDSYFRINDSTNFGMAIAKHIPELIAAFEGPCLYQEKKIIEKDLGYIDPNRFRSPNAIQDFVFQSMAHYPLFLKDKTYAHQVEYRYVWIVSDKKSEYLDLKVPEAIKFCKKGSELTE